MFVLKFLGSLFSEHFQRGYCYTFIFECFTYKILERSLSDLYIEIIDLFVGNSAQAFPLSQLHGYRVNDWLAWLTISDSGLTLWQLYQKLDNWSARES